MVGDNTDLIVLLLHKTKDMELNTAQLFFRTSLFLLPACVRNKPFMIHTQFLLGVWIQHDFQDIYEGHKKFFGIPEADTNFLCLYNIKFLISFLKTRKLL